MTITVGTLNIRFRLPAGEARSAARAMLEAGEQVGGRQESNNRVALFEELGYEVFQPRGGGLGIPLIHGGVTAGDGGVFRVTEAFHDPVGAGPDRLAAKHVVWRRYTDPDTGGVLTVANTHGIPSIGQPDRRAIHAGHFRRLAAWARETPGPMVLVGDLNAQWGHANLHPLRAAGFRLANPPGVTHKKTRRAIDLILARGVEITGARLVDTPSDHKGVVVTVRVPATVVPPDPQPEVPMPWRVARSLDVLLDEINAAAPQRNKAADGAIGDAAHATRSSDHNPWVVHRGQGIVRARDFTHDPLGGLDCDVLAERLGAIVSTGAHPAARSGAYVIWNRRIVSFDRRAEGWRAYDGSNPHTAHLHLSVALDPAGFDSKKPWGVMDRREPTPNEDDRSDPLDAKIKLPDGKQRTVRQALHQLLAEQARMRADIDRLAALLEDSGPT